MPLSQSSPLYIQSILFPTARGVDTFPFPHLLRCNDPPNEPDATVIRALLLRSQIQASSLDTKIRGVRRGAYNADEPPSLLGHNEDQMHTSLDTLIVERRKTRGIIQNCQIALSPIRRMLDELLLEIFTFCTAMSQNFNVKPPSLLCSVCRRWDIIVLSSPKLWCRFDIELKRLPRVAIVSTHIQRSANYPLSVRLDCTTDRIVHDNARFLAIPNLLLRYANRWQHAELILAPPMLPNFSSAKGRVSLLKSLKLEGHHISASPGDAFEEAPVLRELSLVYRRIPDDLRLPWSQITNCTLEGCDVFEGFYVLQQISANIVEFTLRDCSGVISLDDMSPLPLPLLRSLALLTFHEGTTGDLLDKILCPALHSLRIACEDAPGIAERIIGLISRSSCSLIAISLSQVEISEDDCISLLSFIPNLANLTFDNPDSIITAKLITRLIYLPCESLTLVPRLQSIALAGKFHCTIELLLDMIESRYPNASHFNRLWSVLLTARRLINFDAITRLHALEGRGLLVKLK